MSLIKWNRPQALATKRNWIENFFSEADDFLKTWEWDKTQDVPAMNVEETPDNFRVEVAAPGMKKEDFRVEVDRGVLTISASTESEQEEKTKEYFRREFSYRNFKRSFWLPDNVEADKITASYEDGLLKLSLPKSQACLTGNGKTIKVV